MKSHRPEARESVPPSCRWPSADVFPLSLQCLLFCPLYCPWSPRSCRSCLFAVIAITAPPSILAVARFSFLKFKSGYFLLQWFPSAFTVRIKLLFKKHTSSTLLAILSSRLRPCCPTAWTPTAHSRAQCVYLRVSLQMPFPRRCFCQARRWVRPPGLCFYNSLVVSS